MVAITRIQLNLDREKSHYKFFEDGIYVTSIYELKRVLGKVKTGVWIVKDNVRAYSWEDEQFEIEELVQKWQNDGFDMIWLNKIMNDCSWFSRIDEHLRRAKNPNSIQSIFLSPRAIEKLLRESWEKESDLIKVTNKMTSRSFNLKTAVTINNLMYFDMNFMSNVSDVKKSIECVYDPPSEVDYRGVVMVIFCIFIVVISMYMIWLGKV